MLIQLFVGESKMNAAEALLRLTLGPVEAKQFVIAKQVTRERDRQFCFSDTSWT